MKDIKPMCRMLVPGADGHSYTLTHARAPWRRRRADERLAPVSVAEFRAALRTFVSVNVVLGGDALGSLGYEVRVEDPDPVVRSKTGFRIALRDLV